jgi:hypothetical protein
VDGADPMNDVALGSLLRVAPIAASLHRHAIISVHYWRHTVTCVRVFVLGRSFVVFDRDGLR